MRKPAMFRPTDDPRIIGFSVPSAIQPFADEDVMVIMLDRQPSPAWARIFQRHAEVLAERSALRDLRIVGGNIKVAGTAQDLRGAPHVLQGLIKAVSSDRATEISQELGQQAAKPSACENDRDIRDLEVELAAQVPGIVGMLEHVLELTGLRFAAVARVTDARWTALVVVDRASFGVLPGQDMILERTLCNEVRRLGEAVVFSHASADPRYASHPLPALYGFESHLSVAIHLADGSLFGTLCALDPEPAPLTEDMIGVVRALAGQIGLSLSRATATCVTAEGVADDGRLQRA